MKKLEAVTVYLGSGGKVHKSYYKLVSEFAKIAFRKRVHLVYGGMKAGMMGKLADTALKKGGGITGVIPENIKDFTIIHKKLHKQGKTIVTGDMWERKKEMVHRGEAAVIFPGGYGTIDELFEYLYWGLEGYHNKPCALVNVNGYWDKIIKFIETAIDEGDIDPKIKDMLVICETMECVFKELEAWFEKHHDPDFDDTIFDDGNDFLSRVELKNREDTEGPIMILKTDIEGSYRLANALVLKQLDKIQRPIGVYNTKSAFNYFNDWIKIAAKQKFITPKCPELVVFDDDMERLKDRLARHVHISTDLHQKWDNK